MGLPPPRFNVREGKLGVPPPLFAIKPHFRLSWQGLRVQKSMLGAVTAERPKKYVLAENYAFNVRCSSPLPPLVTYLVLFSRLVAAVALEFSTFAISVLEVLAPSCSSRTSGIERSPAPCCSSQCGAVLACLLLQRGRFCFGTSRRCAPRDAERAARELRRQPASRERQRALGIHAAQHAWPAWRSLCSTRANLLIYVPH